MAEFKICIADPKSGKTYQTELKDADASSLLGRNIGDTIKGEAFSLTGAELLVTGGSDKAGFPMRRGIKDARKRLNLLGGVGLRKKLARGTRVRKIVCGHKISETTAQVNLKLIKEGSKNLAEAFAAPEKEKTA